MRRAARTAAVRAAAFVIALAAALAAAGRPAMAGPRLAPAARARGSIAIAVLAEPGLERTARKLAARAERQLARISADLPDLAKPKAIEVRLVRDVQDLAAVAPAGRGAPSWAVGVAYPDLGVVSVATRRGGQLVDPEATLDHELAHVALGAALGARAPRWLHEGFAYQHSAEWSWERTETLAGMAWSHHIIPLDQLDRTFPQAELPASRAYAESYDFVGFLTRRGRWEDPGDDGDRWPFRRFLREVGQGSDLDRAAIRAFGKPLHALFDEWQADLGNRYLLMPLGFFGAVLWLLCVLLLGLAWWRKRQHNRKRLAEWDLEERLRRHSEPGSRVDASSPGDDSPGDDSPGSDPEDDDRPPDDPRWLN